MDISQFNSLHQEIDQRPIGHTAIPRDSTITGQYDFAHLVCASLESLQSSMTKVGIEKAHIIPIDYASIIRGMHQEISWHFDFEAARRFQETMAADLRFVRKLYADEIPIGTVLGHEITSFDGGSAALRDELDSFVVGYAATSDGGGELQDEYGRTIITGAADALRDRIGTANSEYRIVPIRYQDIVKKSADSLSTDVVVEQRIWDLRVHDLLCTRWQEDEEDQNDDDEAFVARGEEFTRERGVERNNATNE